MEQKSNKFFKWVIIYGITFGILTASFDFLQSKTVFVLKNVIGGLIFGLAMAFFNTRAQKRKEENTK